MSDGVPPWGGSAVIIKDGVDPHYMFCWLLENRLVIIISCSDELRGCAFFFFS